MVPYGFAENRSNPRASAGSEEESRSPRNRRQRSNPRVSAGRRSVPALTLSRWLSKQSAHERMTNKGENNGR
nr:MAG TPA_asm: hypothetical protein [Caudoviricetes sp.]